MNREVILKQLRQPGPLVIRTANGEEFPVPHSEFVFVGRFNLAIEVEGSAFDILDPLRSFPFSPNAPKINAATGIDFFSY